MTSNQIAIFHKDRLILDLCGGTGEWSRPYAEAGYPVRVVDIQNGQDVRLMQKMETSVYGILAAPVCTVFAVSGNRWKRTDDDYREALALVDACLRIIMVHNPVFWALENPVGKLVRWIGRPRMYFQPNDFGDAYTKKTALWGNFNIPVKNWVPAVEGSKMWAKYGGKSERTKRLRSVTPAQFALKFFEANQ